MSFYAFHGDDKSEQQLGQRYEVDVDMAVDTELAARNDDLHDAVNYKSVFHLVEKIVVAGKRYNLIESLAADIAGAILRQYPVPEVRVAVRKLKPPINGILDYVEVSLCRRKTLNN